MTPVRCNHCWVNTGGVHAILGSIEGAHLHAPGHAAARSHWLAGTGTQFHRTHADRPGSNKHAHRHAPGAAARSTGDGLQPHCTGAGVAETKPRHAHLHAPGHAAARSHWLAGTGAQFSTNTKACSSTREWCPCCIVPGPGVGGGDTMHGIARMWAGAPRPADCP